MMIPDTLAWAMIEDIYHSEGNLPIIDRQKLDLGIYGSFIRNRERVSGY